MASVRQRAAARKNIKKTAAAAKKKRTIAHLPKKTRTAFGKQANKVKREKAAKKSLVSWRHPVARSRLMRWRGFFPPPVTRQSGFRYQPHASAPWRGALVERREGNPKLLVLRLVPGGPQAELESAAGDVVDRDRLGGQDRRVAVGDAGYQNPEADP